MAIKLNRTQVTMGLSATAAVVLTGWLWFAGLAETQAHRPAPPLTLNTAVLDATDDVQAPAAADQPATTPASTEPLGRLRISRQSFTRGGMGSKALMTFTVRNRNDYAVKDLDLLCKFRSRDGSYETERRRTLRDTVDSKSRKVFPLTHIGFVNIRASKASCALLAAARV
jgi:hypothetical protein